MLVQMLPVTPQFKTLNPPTLSISQGGLMNIRLPKLVRIKLTHYRYSRGVCLHRHPLTFLNMTRLG